MKKSINLSKEVVEDIERLSILQGRSFSSQANFLLKKYISAMYDAEIREQKRAEKKMQLDREVGL